VPFHGEISLFSLFPLKINQNWLKSGTELLKLSFIAILLIFFLFISRKSCSFAKVMWFTWEFGQI